jgi:predicted small lipoprotein YifL
MRKAFLSAACVAATLSLIACGQQEPEVVNTVVDPQAEALKNAPPVELPPAIRASKTYRCRDNSLLYANFYTDNSARIATEQSAVATGTQLRSEGEDGPFTAEGYSLSGSGDNVTYTSPSGTLTCRT